MASEQRSWLKVFGLGCIVILALLIVAVVASIFGLRSYLHHKATQNMTPEEVQALNAFFEEPVEVPAEWRIVEPFPSEVIEAGEKVRTLAARLLEGNEEWSELLKRLQQGESLTETEWERLKNAVEREQPLIEAVKTLAQTPGYELEAFPPEKPGDDLPHFLTAQICSKLLCAQAYLFEKEYRWEEAFESALAGYRLAERHPASALITHLIGIAVDSIASHCIANLTHQCSDPEILQGVLLRLEEMDPRIHLACLEDPAWVDTVGMLRGLARKGNRVDLESKQPRVYFYLQWIELAGSPEKGNRLGDIPLLSRPILELLYSIGRPDPREVQIREKTAKVQFDLARLTIARRIDTLTRSGVETTAQLAGRLIDPFTDAPYRYSEARQFYFSVGPDQSDQGMTVPYDPTNGTVSEGDIEL